MEFELETRVCKNRMPYLWEYRWGGIATATLQAITDILPFGRGVLSDGGIFHMLRSRLSLSID